MGNRSSSSLVAIHADLCSRNKNKPDDQLDEALNLLDNIIECVDSFSGDYTKLNSKDIKLLASITSLLADEFGVVFSTPCAPAVILIKLKALAAINRLLQIPFVSKNALENCLMGLVNCLNPSYPKLLTLALNCIFLGVISVNDDAFKSSNCLLLDNLGFYQQMLEIFDMVAKDTGDEKSKDSGLLLPAMLMFAQHLVWILSQEMSQSGTHAVLATFKAFKKRLNSKIFKHQDTIFELTRHPEKPVQFAATMLLVEVLHIQERKQCAIIQENARNKGLVLWTLQRLAQHSLEARRIEASQLHHHVEDAANASGVCVPDSSGGSLNVGEIPWVRGASWVRHIPDVEGVTFHPCESEVASEESMLDSVRLLLTLLCLGDKANEAAMFRALPESFSSFLSLHPSHDVSTHRDDEAPSANAGSSSAAGTKRSPMSFFAAIKATPKLKSLFHLQHSNSSGSFSAPAIDASMSSSVHSTGVEAAAVDTGANTMALLSNGGAEVRVPYAAKMGVHDRGSWHVLFAVLCEDFESPKMVWNDSTLEHLFISLKSASRDLDRQRAISYESWDVRSLDVSYPLYSTRQFLCVRGVFLPQLIDELQVQGRTFYLDDPHGALWAILDRATVEAERVFSELMRGNERVGIAQSIAVDEVVTSDSGCCMQDLSIYLEAILLLLARYHPELHRVTPIYALCGVLKKGISAITILSQSGDICKDFKSLFDIENSLLRWINTTLGILQCRLSGPISRDDWSDFAAAGGADALCVIVTSPPLSAHGMAHWGALSASLCDVTSSGAGSPDVKEVTSGGNVRNTLHSAYVNAVQREDELLILSAQLLQNLVVSGSKYALAFACPAGADQLSAAIWLLSRRLKCSSGPCGAGVAAQGGQPVSASVSTANKDWTGVPAVSSALSSLVSVAQRVCNASKGQFHGLDDVSQSAALLLLADQRMLLIRVLMASAIYPEAQSICSTAAAQEEVSCTSTGLLSISTAKLLQDLLILVESDFTTFGTSMNSSIVTEPQSTPSSSSISTDTLTEVQGMYRTLLSAIPERLLSLCRRLPPTEFTAVFNTQVDLFTPEIIWSPFLRLECLRSIETDLSDWAGRIGGTRGRYPPVWSYSSESLSVPNVADPLSVTAQRFPTLTSEPEVLGVFLQPFLHCKKKEFLIPLGSLAFAKALNMEMINCSEVCRSKSCCLVSLCLSRVVQLWAQDLPLELWCCTLAPTLLHTIMQCIKQLSFSPSPLPSIACPTVELLKCSTCCVICVASYLRINVTFRSSKGPKSLAASSGSVDAQYVGPSCAELIEAAAPALSEVISRCVSLILADTAAKHGEEGFEAAGPVCASSSLALEAATALLATISLHLGEEAHIERVRLREYLSRQEGAAQSSLPVPIAPNAEKGSGPQGGLKLVHPGSVDDDQNPLVSSESPSTPATPSILQETAQRLDVAKRALRQNSNRLLAASVSCCRAEVARAAPVAALSAISALHLFVGMETEDSTPETRTMPMGSLIEVLCGLGLPDILLQTIILVLDDHAASLCAAPISATEEAKSDGSRVPMDAQTDGHLTFKRWSSHPLLTTDRFIRSTLPPVQFLPSPRTQPSLSNEILRKEIEVDEVVVLESLPKVLHSILEDAESALKSDFSAIRESDSRQFRASSSVRLALARECTELLRLMAICPSAQPPLVGRGPSLSSSSAFLAKESSGYPVSISSLSVTRLNHLVGHSLEQFLTAPMLLVMMTDVPLFLSTLSSSTPVRRPILVWDSVMRANLTAVLRKGNKIHAAALSEIFQGPGSKISSATSADISCAAIATMSDTAQCMAEELRVEDSSEVQSLATLHSQLSSECLVDNVYIRYLAPGIGSERGGTVSDRKEHASNKCEDCLDDIGVRDLARFLESLQASISSNKVVIEHLLKTSNTAQLPLLKSQLALKERVLTKMLADHDELGYGYADLYLDS